MKDTIKMVMKHQMANDIYELKGVIPRIIHSPVRNNNELHKCNAAAG